MGARCSDEPNAALVGVKGSPRRAVVGDPDPVLAVVGVLGVETIVPSQRGLKTEMESRVGRLA